MWGTAEEKISKKSEQKRQLKKKTGRRREGRNQKGIDHRRGVDVENWVTENKKGNKRNKTDMPIALSSPTAAKHTLQEEPNDQTCHLHPLREQP